MAAIATRTGEVAPPLGGFVSGSLMVLAFILALVGVAYVDEHDPDLLVWAAALCWGCVAAVAALAISLRAARDRA